MKETNRCDEGDHEWKEPKDSQFSNETYGEVVCRLCGVHGEMTWKTGEVYWPTS
jgi:hypothetical protein